ncbi:hypothetical protein CCYA_CCYA15G3908 [Cyanidiococcus yangmingshanensis]|nr:hypothetical protein CCYA_CCYA15G3908 [Cyanidiococcus yangmingshanensis]
MRKIDARTAAQHGPENASHVGMPLWEQLDEAEAADLTLASRRALAGLGGSRVGEVASEILGKATLLPEHMERTLSTFADTVYLAHRRKSSSRSAISIPSAPGSGIAKGDIVPASGAEGTRWRQRRQQRTDTSTNSHALGLHDQSRSEKLQTVTTIAVSAASARQSREHRLGILRKRRREQITSGVKLDHPRWAMPLERHASTDHLSVALHQHDPPNPGRAPKHAVSKLASCLRTLRHPNSESDSSRGTPVGWAALFSRPLSSESSTNSAAASDTSLTSECCRSAISADCDDDRVPLKRTPGWYPYGADESPRVQSRGEPLSSNRPRVLSHVMIDRDMQISPVSRESTECNKSEPHVKARRMNLQLVLDSASTFEGALTHDSRKDMAEKNRRSTPLSRTEGRLASERTLTARARLQARLKNSRAFGTQR